MPKNVSRSATAADTVGWVTPHSRAAAVNEPSRFDAEAYRSAGMETIGNDYTNIGARGIAFDLLGPQTGGSGQRPDYRGGSNAVRTNLSIFP